MRFQILLLVMFSSVAFGEGTPRQQIKSVLDLQARAWNSGDIAGYMKGYWNSDSLVFTSGGSVSRGWQETFDKYSKKYNSREKMGTLVFTDLEISILSGNVAWVLGKWRLERSSDQPHGVFTLVFRRFADGWKIVHDHTSLSAD